MKKIKKIIILCIIIFLILIVAFLIVKYMSSRNYMKRLLDKGCNNINYSYTDEELKMFVKENIEKSIYSNGNILYSDYNTGEKIFIDVENKQISIVKQKEKYSGPQKSKYAEDIKEKEYDFKGKETIKEGINCYVIDLYRMNDNNSNYLVTRIWVNCKLGIIEKMAYYDKNKTKEKLISEEILDMHTGVVTDSDIQKPDFKDYPNYEIINVK